ncbi:MAG: VWA domain-containing protein [Promethearchaeota archaeon]
MSERLAENIVIAIDCSRSMFRTDYQPNRLQSCITALKRLISHRIEEDEASAFAIVAFNDTAIKVVDFTNLVNELYEALDSLTFQGRSAMGEAIALGIKMIISELRKIAAKIPRILVVSDGNYTRTAVDPLKMARLSQGLSIKIDSFRLGEVSHLNILKRLSDLTGGRYYYNNDSDSLLESAKQLAEANVKTLGAGSESPIENPAFLRKIAANLLRVQDLTKDQEDKLKAMRGETDFKKCSICFADKDPVTKGSFYLTGRYCPNCQTPYHIHCLAGWAAAQKDAKLKESGTCRCPHCFYLLKIPTEVTQAQKLRTLSTPSITGPSQASEFFTAKKYEDIAVLGDEALYNSCPVCHLIFEEGQQAIQCGNPDCRALYHSECFIKLNDSRCKNCGVKLTIV